MTYNNIIESIGNTPVVRLGAGVSEKIKFFAKLEGQNPGGSVKDRVALAMIEKAEHEGLLLKSRVILEPTSGNTGIGLALVGIAKGYSVVLTISAAMSRERMMILRAMGAGVIETDPALRTDGAIRKAREMVENDPDRYWMPFQFDNPENVKAHYQTTGAEIIQQVPDITHFVAGMGTTGTLIGVGKRLKEYNPSVQVIGVMPAKGQRIQGLKNLSESIVPRIFDPSVPDRIIQVKTEDALHTARNLAHQEGILVGISSGAALFGARRVSEDMKQKHAVIVVLFPDRGEKYLSTSLFKDEVVDEK